MLPTQDVGEELADPSDDPAFASARQAVHKIEKGVIVGRLDRAGALFEPFVFNPCGNMCEHRVLFLVGAQPFED